MFSPNTDSKDALIALGLVLTGIIAESEALMVNIGRWLVGR